MINYYDITMIIIKQIFSINNIINILFYYKINNNKGYQMIYHIYICKLSIIQQ